MIYPASPRHRAPTLRVRGFTLLNVLVAALIFGLGMLGLVRAFVGVTSAATQNENVSTLTSLSNSFWGVLQANSGLLNAGGILGTNTYTTVAAVPAALQPWMTTVVNTLPSPSAKIETSADPASGNPCTQHGGCTVKLTLSWLQVGAPGIGAQATRSQVFYYVIGR